MQVTIEKKRLLPALRAAEATAKETKPIAPLKLAVEGNWLALTGGTEEMNLTAHVPAFPGGKGSKGCRVPGAALIKLIAAQPAGKLTLTFGKELTVEGPRGLARLGVVRGKAPGAMEDGGRFAASAVLSGFGQKLALASAVMGLDDTRANICGVRFVCGEDIRLSATDGHRATQLQADLTAPLPEAAVLLTPPQVKAAQRLIALSSMSPRIGIGEETLQLAVPGFRFTCRTLPSPAKEYPDFKKVWPKKKTHRFVVGAGRLREGIQALNLRGDRYPAVKIIHEEDGLRMTRNAEEQMTESRVAVRANGPLPEFGINGNYLASAMTGMKDSEELKLSMSAPTKPMLLEQPLGQVVIMPMAL